jgi:hypothetical protein
MLRRLISLFRRKPRATASPPRRRNNAKPAVNSPRRNNAKQAVNSPRRNNAQQAANSPRRKNAMVAPTVYFNTKTRKFLYNPQPWYNYVRNPRYIHESQLTN